MIIYNIITSINGKYNHLIKKNKNLKKVYFCLCLLLVIDFCFVYNYATIVFLVKVIIDVR